MNRFTLLLLAVLLSVTSSVLAQDGYAPDRPGQTIPTTTMPEGKISLEAGFVWSHAEYTPVRPLTFAPTWTIYSHDLFDLPQGLLRVGLGDGFELRFSSSYTRWHWEYDPNYFSGSNTDVPVINTVNAGLNLLNVGIKSVLRDEVGVLPGMALVAGLSFPQTGSPVFRIRYMAPDFALAFSHTLSDQVSIGYHAGMRWDGAVASPTSFYAANMGVSIHSDVQAFLEFFGELPGYAPAMHQVDLGCAWRTTEDLVLDAAFGMGLHSPGEAESAPKWVTVLATDVFVNVGASWRLKVW